MRNGEVEYTSGGNKKGPSLWTGHTGVTNKGQVDPSDLHSKLRDLFGDITTVEELNKVMEENEDPSGLTDDESDESDDED